MLAAVLTAGRCAAAAQAPPPVPHASRAAAVPAGFAPPIQTLFTPVVMLARPGPDRAARAVALFDRAVAFHRKIAFHPRLDAELQGLVDKLPPRQSTLIRAAALYSSDDIPWRDRPPDTHYIAVRGRPDTSDYLYSLAPSFGRPERPGDFAGIFALRPVAPPNDGQAPTAMIGELGGAIMLDTFGAGSAADALGALLRETYGDLTPPWDAAPGEYNQHDRAAQARFERDLPAFAARLRHYLDFHNIVDELAGPDGPLVLYNLDATIREEALKPYPHLYNFYRKVAPRLEVDSVIDDLQGHQWLHAGFQRGRIRLVVLVRAGMLTPMDAGFAPAGQSVALGEVRQGRYRSVASVHVRSLGMTFGLDGVTFVTQYNRDGGSVRISSRMTEVPKVVAPPVLRRMILLIAGEFMRALAGGNGGRGVSAAFTSEHPPGSEVRLAGAITAELRYSPTLEFLARIGDAIANSHNLEVRTDERRLGEDLFNAMVADYQKARPRIVALDGLRPDGR